MASLQNDDSFAATHQLPAALGRLDVEDELVGTLVLVDAAERRSVEGAEVVACAVGRHVGEEAVGRALVLRGRRRLDGPRRRIRLELVLFFLFRLWLGLGLGLIDLWFLRFRLGFRRRWRLDIGLF